MRRPSLKAVSGFGVVSLLGSVLAVAACSSDDSGDPPSSTGGVTGTGGSTPTGGTPASGSGGKATGGNTTGTGGTPPGTGGGPPANAYDINIVIDNVKFIGMGTPSGGMGGSATGGSGGATSGSGGGGAGGTLSGGTAGGGGKASGGGGASGGGAGKSSKSVLPPQFQQVGGAGAGGASGGAGGAKGGAGGSGGSGGAPSAGSGGTLGGGGGGGMPAGGMPAGGSGGGSGICTPAVVMDPLITDFETNWATDQFKAAGYTGGLFAYPQTGVTPIAFAVAKGEASFTGKVGTYSGFGIWLSCEIDASQFQGVEFDIKGNPGASGQLKFLVQTSPNVYDTAAGKDHDTCVPANPMASYESCVNPSKMISVTAAGNHVTVMWAELGMGKPMMNVDQKQILGLQWDFAWPPMAATGTGGMTGTGGTPAATGGMPATGGMSAAGAGGGGSGGGGAGGGGSGGGGSGGGGSAGKAGGSGGGAGGSGGKN